MPAAAHRVSIDHGATDPRITSVNATVRLNGDSLNTGTSPRRRKRVHSRFGVAATGHQELARGAERHLARVDPFRHLDALPLPGPDPCPPRAQPPARGLGAGDITDELTREHCSSGRRNDARGRCHCEARIHTACRSLVFSGDALGSGFGQAFGTVERLRQVAEDSRNLVNYIKGHYVPYERYLLRVYTGHWWQNAYGGFLHPHKASTDVGYLDWRFIQDVSACANGIFQGEWLVEGTGVKYMGNMLYADAWGSAAGSGVPRIQWRPPHLPV